MATITRPGFAGRSTTHGARDLIQWENLGNIQSPPSCLKCLIDGTSCIQLSLNRDIVAADKIDSGVHKNKLPEGSLRRRSIGGISRNGSTLRQYVRIRSNVRTKSNFYDVMDPVDRQSPDSFHQFLASQQNFVCTCSQSDFPVALRTAGGNDSRSARCAS